MSTTFVPDVSIADSLGRINRAMSNKFQREGYHTLADLMAIPVEDYLMVSDWNSVGVNRFRAFARWIEAIMKENPDFVPAEWMKKAFIRKRIWSEDVE